MHRLATVHALDNQRRHDTAYLNKRLFYESKVRRLKICCGNLLEVSLDGFVDTLLFKEFNMSGSFVDIMYIVIKQKVADLKDKSTRLYVSVCAVTGGL